MVMFPVHQVFQPQTTPPTPSASVSPARRGLSFDDCTRDEDCVSPRKCAPLDPTQTCDQDTCVCAHPAIEVCRDQSDCADGECCYSPPNGVKSCVSRRFTVGVGKDLAPLCADIPDAKASPLPSPSGLVEQFCRDNSDCSGKRLCGYRGVNDVIPCENGPNCKCLPRTPLFCTARNQCGSGEVCVEVFGFGTECIEENVARKMGFPKVEDLFTTPGYSFEQCTTDAHCVGRRKCLDRDEVSCSGEARCYCTPPTIVPCSYTTQCVPEECCVLTSKTCTSINAAPEFKNVCDIGGGTPEPIKPSEEPIYGGLTLDKCKSDQHCLPPRTCQTDNLSDTQPCHRTNCRCYPASPTDCQGENDCVEGECCGVLPGFMNFCQSPRFGAAIPEVTCLEPFDMAPTPLPSLGLTEEPCVDTSNCSGNRLCGNMGVNRVLPCDNGPFCTCLPPSPNYCTSSDQCVSGEICVEVFGFATECIEEDAAMEKGFPKVEDKYTKKGYSFEQCSTDSHCVRPRRCVAGDNLSDGQCSGKTRCFCIPPASVPCSGSDECVTRECCQLASETCRSVNAAREFSEACREDIAPSLAPLMFPVLETTSPEDGVDMETPSPENNGVVAQPGISSSATPSPTRVPEVSPIPETEVCIGTHSLKHLMRNQLIYESDRLAWVLCDAFNSCATAGHMVVYRGKPMMMNTYCVTVGCTKQVMHVNSPKWGPAFKMSSETAGLEFLAYAARYGTRTEQSILSSLVHLGL